MGRIKEAISKNPLFNTLITLDGNPRACVYTEPLWSIPFNLYSPFMTLFMYNLGVKDSQIGLLLTIGMLLQCGMSLMGGIATDKLGRKKTTFIFDVLAWSVPCLIWAFAQNFWWFLAGAAVNSLLVVTHNSWGCLLAEDADQKKLVDIYTWVTFSGLLAVFFAPISGVLVEKFPLVPVVRCIFLFAFASMTLKFFILNKMCTETKQGLVRVEETKHQSVWSMLGEYTGVFRDIISSKATLLVLLLMFITNTTNMISTNFFSLYITLKLHVPEQWVAYFPMARAAIMICFIFLAQGKVNRLPFRPVMICGIGFYIVAITTLLLAPENNIGVLALYVVCEAIGHALLYPRKDSLMFLFIDPKKRARVQGLLYVLMIGFTSPFGTLAGVLSEVNRSLPFLLSMLLFAICAAFIIGSKEIRKLDKSHRYQH